MLISDEQKSYFLARHDALMKDGSADPTEKKIVETAVTVIQLEPLIALAEQGQQEIDKLHQAIEGVLRILFGNDVCISNIRDRFVDLTMSIDNNLQIALAEEKSSNNSKKTVVGLHLLLAQRILQTVVGFYVKRLEIHWLWNEQDIEQCTMSFNILQHLIVYLKLIPTYVSLRDMPVLSIIDVDLNVSYEQFAINRNCGTASFKVDLLQPREAILQAFKDFVDQAKREMRSIPENLKVLTLYDVRRAADGRPVKSPYATWHGGIMDIEDAMDFKSFYEAARQWPTDPESEARKVSFRVNRFHSLLNSIFNGRFPSIDKIPSPSEH